MKELLQILFIPQSDDEKSLRIMMLINAVMIMALITYAILFPVPTQDQATQKILKEHPECTGVIEIKEIEWIGRGSSGKSYYAVCDKAEIGIHIRGPK